MVAVCTAKQHCTLTDEQSGMTFPQGLFLCQNFKFIRLVFIFPVLYFQIHYISS